MYNWFACGSISDLKPTVVHSSVTGNLIWGWLNLKYKTLRFRGSIYGIVHEIIFMPKTTVYSEHAFSRLLPFPFRSHHPPPSHIPFPFTSTRLLFSPFRSPPPPLRIFLQSVHSQTPEWFSGASERAKSHPSFITQSITSTNLVENFSY